MFRSRGRAYLNHLVQHHCRWENARHPRIRIWHQGSSWPTSDKHRSAFAELQDAEDWVDCFFCLAKHLTPSDSWITLLDASRASHFRQKNWRSRRMDKKVGKVDNARWTANIRRHASQTLPKPVEGVLVGFAKEQQGIRIKRIKRHSAWLIRSVLCCTHQMELQPRGFILKFSPRWHTLAIQPCKNWAVAWAGEMEEMSWMASHEILWVFGQLFPTCESEFCWDSVDKRRSKEDFKRKGLKSVFARWCLLEPFWTGWCSTLGTTAAKFAMGPGKPTLGVGKSQKKLYRAWWQTNCFRGVWSALKVEIL